jgi:hypothetical protein
MAATTSVGRPKPGASPAGGQQSAAESERERSSLVHRLEQRVVNNLNERKGRVSQTLDSLVQTARRMSEPLQEQPYPALARAATRTVDRMERIASVVRDRDVREVPDDLRALARRSPGAYLGIGLAAGLLAGRFLRSTSERADGAAPAARAAAATRHRNSLAADRSAGTRRRVKPLV